MKKQFIRILSAVLVISMIISAFPSNVFAYYADRNEEGTLTIEDSDGNVIFVDESWETTFPYGTFAFASGELTLTEGDEGKITVYRLGGTKGRATAYITYIPAAASIDENTITYAHAAGSRDISIRVEDTLPIARYQLVGKDPDPFESQFSITSEQKEEELILDLGAAGADSYQWYIFADETWQEVIDAVDSTFIIDTDIEGYDIYDFCCVYTKDGMAYRTDSVKGEVYEYSEQEVLPEIPGDIDLDPPVTYTELPMDDPDEYAGYVFELVFAENEWVKDIYVSSMDSGIARPDKFGVFTIIGNEGASLYETANKLMLQIINEIPAEPSGIGFAITEITVDKAEGSAFLTVERTGGKTNVLTVDYATADETAVSGKDYVETNGTLVFYADIDTQIIEIELINDKTESYDLLDFTVSLSNLLGDGEGNSEISELTATVSLYNTNISGAGDNIATILYDAAADVIDISDLVTEAKNPIAPVEIEAATGESTEEPEDIGVEITVTEGVRLSRSYSYPATSNISFSRTVGYNGWQDWAQYTGSYNFGKGATDRAVYRTVSHTGARDSATKFPISDMAAMYSSMSAWFEWKPSSISTSGFPFYNRPDYNYPYFCIEKYEVVNKTTMINSLCWTDCTLPAGIQGNWPDYYCRYQISNTNLGMTWDISDDLRGVRIGVSSFNNRRDSGNATGTISESVLQRRIFTQREMSLIIHTANDIGAAGDIRTAPDGAAVLDASTGVYESMKPTVSFYNGGVTLNGNLYVGSTIRVNLAATPAYFLAVPSNGDLEYAVYLTNDLGEIKMRGARISDSVYEFKMLWNGITEDDLERKYTVNVVMTRRQNISIDLSPSVPRLIDPETGNILGNIDPGKIEETRSAFIKSGDIIVTYGYSPVRNNNLDPYTTVESIGTFTKNLLNYNPSTAVMELNNMTNVHWINFNLSHEDILLYNGRMYSGDENIYLTVRDLALANMTFYYYSEEFRSAPNIMVPNIIQTALYLDKNGNGQIDGYYNEETGYFVLDKDESGSDIDEFIFFLEPGASYDENIFVPIDRNQYFLKTEYTMNPRSLEAPAGANESDRMQIIPAYITNITNLDKYDTLTAEQKAYSYVLSGKSRVYENKQDYSDNENPADYGYSSDNKLMYGAAATKPSSVDIPVGGDLSPAKLNPAGTAYIWNPDYRPGNLLYDFINPDPIYIPESLAGPNIPIKEDDLNDYLGAFTGDTIFTLSVQEQKTGMDGFISERNNPESRPEIKPESIVASSNSAFPDPEPQKVQNDDEKESEKAGTDGSGNAYDEFDVDLGIKLPALNFNVTDYVQITTYYHDIGITIGIPLGGYDSSRDEGEKWQGPKKANQNKAEDMGKIKNFLSGKGLDKDNDYMKAKNGGEFKSSSFSVSFSLSLAILLRYNPVDNKFMFFKATIAFQGSLEFKYQYRLSVCPIVYIYVKMGGSISVGTGFRVDREPREEEGEPALANLTLRKGESVPFKTNYKAFNMTFNGKVLITSDIPNAQNGTFSSKGGKPVTFIMLVQKGNKLSKEGEITITALEDTNIIRAARVVEADSVVLWNGINIEPSLFIEAGAGVGIEFLKLELFIKLSVSCAMTFGPSERIYDRNTGEYKTEMGAFNFDWFDLSIGLGIRVVLLIFAFEMDAFKYTLWYENRAPGYADTWSHYMTYVSIIGDENVIGKTSGENFVAAAFDMTDAPPQDTGVRIKMPGSTEYTQIIYEPPQEYTGGFMPFAFTPSGLDTPFQLSGYGASGDAFRLADGLITGYDYRIVTVGNDNYIVYTISRSGAENPVDNSMLVLSKLKVTSVGGVESYGLVNPVDENEDLPYIILDDDGTGDLDFSVWSDEKIIRAAWVSYAAVSAPPPVPADNEYIQNIAANSAKNTEIRTASFDTEKGDPFTEAVKVSGEAGANKYLPKSAGDGSVTFYAEAIHGDSDWLNGELGKLDKYLSGQYPTDKLEGARLQATQNMHDFRMLYQKGIWELYGKETYLSAAVNDKIIKTQLPERQIIDSIDVTYDKTEKIYYVSYITSQYASSPDGDNFVTVRRLYLRTFNGTVWSDAYLIRTLRDFDVNNGKDGVYSNGKLTTPYDDPYFANLKFLNGKIGEFLQDGEPVGIRSLSSAQPENFLLFEMNGTTYIIPNKDIKNIVNSKPGTLYPFFKPADIVNADGSEVPQTSSGRSEVTIGSDGAGNISAVYAAGVPNTMNNALYLTKYDPETGTWGVGTMLAMHNMQVYEDSFGEDWTNEETEQAYLGLLSGYKGTPRAMEYFNFSNLQIALGLTAPDENTELGDGDLGIISTDENDAAGVRDTLLVITQGSLTKLKEITIDSNQKEIVPDGSASVGIYAISYGVGNQCIGEDKLSFYDYNFSAGSELTASLKFKNTGDVAIRGSEANPIKVTLEVITPDNEIQKLASWEIKENIISGREVALLDNLKQLGETLPAGSIFYMTISEDGGYVNQPFTADTLIRDGGGKIIGGTFVVESKPELGFENFKTSIAKINENGDIVLNVEFLVGNRGTEAAKEVLAQFSYESGKNESAGESEYTPVNLTGHTLKVGEQTALQPRMRTVDTDLPNGIFKLTGPEGNADIDSGYGREIKGTIIVPYEAYSKSVTGVLDLKVDIYSDADILTGYNAGIITADRGEYNTANNTRTIGIEHETFFTTASRLTLTPGNTMRLPVILSTSSGTSAPVIIAEEIIMPGESKNIGVLNFIPGAYNKGHMTGTLIIAPSVVPEEGQSVSGKIHLKDLNTNSIHIITYIIRDPGEGIDIHIENGYFTFINANKNIYTGSGTDWKFTDGVQTWGTDINGSMLTNNPPLNNHIAAAVKGASFEFTTVAKDIDFYFDGTIQIESDVFSGAKILTLPNTGGGKTIFDTINFGDNPQNYPFKIKVTVVSESAQFDKIVERYTGGIVPLPKRDENAPHIYWSRNFPDPASVKKGEPENNVKLICYVIDDNELASVTYDGIEQLSAGETQFTQFNVTVTENTASISISAMDTAGNRAAQNIPINWYNEIISGDANSDAPDLDVKFTGNDGKALTDFVISGQTAYLDVITAAGNKITANALEFSEDGDLLILTLLNPTSENPNRFVITNNGFYRVDVEADDGTWAMAVVEMNLIDREVPVISLKYNKSVNPDGTVGYELEWGAMKNPGTPANSAVIEYVTINNAACLYSYDRARTVSGTFPIYFNGEYILMAEDNSGNFNSQNIIITDIPVNLSDPDLINAKNSWNQAQNNGEIIITPHLINGGGYNPVTSVLHLNRYYGKYQYILVPSDEIIDFEDEQLELEWRDSTDSDIYSDLIPGAYKLYVRSKLDVSEQNANVNWIENMAFTEIIIENEAVNFTTVSSPADWSQSNGSIKVEAGGGKNFEGIYQFSILDNPDLFGPAEKMEGSGAKWITGNISDAVNLFDGLPAGEYQIGVRAILGIDVNALRDLYNKKTAAFEQFQKAEADTEEETINFGAANYINSFNSNYLQQVINFRTGKMPEEQEEIDAIEAAFGAYLQITEELTTGAAGDNPIFEKLSYWLDETDPDDAEAFETAKSAYDEIFAYYVRKLIVENVEAEFNKAKSAFDTISNEYGALLQSGADLYETDPDLWLNALNAIVTVSAKPIPPYIVYEPKNPVNEDKFENESENKYENENKSEIGEENNGGNTINTDEDAVVILDSDVSLDYSVIIDNPFGDIKESDWFYDDVMFAYSHGLMVGTSADPAMFSPNMPITRAMVVTVLYRLLGSPLVNDLANPFGDVLENTWYTDAVIWAAENGIVNGYGDYKFGPDDNITRQDLAVIFYRFEQFTDKIPMDTVMDREFNDWNDISDYAKNAVNALTIQGILNGYEDGAFRPVGQATRAEFAAVLRRFIEAW